ncbi:MAG: sortase [Anaerolineae bacterium]|nr:sortase [Anaerolineae bacterium]
MRYESRARRSWMAVGLVLTMGVVGGILGGVYFFLSAQDEAREVADIPILPPNMALSSPSAPGQAEAPGLPAEFSLPGVAPLSNPASFPRILAPGAQLDGIVVTSYLRDAGWEIRHLDDRVGHLEGTAWLGSGSNIVLAGHVELVDGRVGAFGQLDKMVVGDEIVLTEQGREYRYRVTEIREVEPTDLSVVYPTATERLTLITCGDYDFLSDSYQVRIVVIAERIA